MNTANGCTKEYLCPKIISDIAIGLFWFPIVDWTALKLIKDLNLELK